MSPLDETRTLSDPGAQLAAHWPHPAILPSELPSSVGTWPLRRAIVRARRALIAMRHEEASRAMTELGRLLGAGTRSSQVRYGSAARVLQGCLSAAGDQLAAARSVLTSSPALPPDDVALSLLRYLGWKSGERRLALTPDTVDYLTAPVGGQASRRILSLCISAALAFDRLQLTVSGALAAQALQLARDRYAHHAPISCLPAVLLAQVEYQQGRLNEAETLLRSRIAAIYASGMPECIARASVVLARLRLHRGHHREALEILREAETLGRARRWPRVISVASRERARALSVIREGRSPEPTASAGCSPFARCSCAAAQAPLPSSGRASSWADTEVLQQNEAPTFSSVERALEEACCTASQACLDRNRQVLIQCLRVGAARGLRMIFVDAGGKALELLERLYRAPPADDARLSDLRPYMATLLKSAVPSSSAEREPPSYRPLSCRELGILQMIARGHCNKRIAQSLGITPETVKSHAKSIFVKLATRTRAQAVARAEAIGLL